MLLTKLFTSKKTFVISTGETIIDLISSTFRFGENQSSPGPAIVSSEEAMRPDLIAERIYSNQDHWASVLKYNGISNPFSLDPGEILLVPAYKAVQTMIGAPKEVFEKGTEPAKKNESLIISPKNKKDQKRLDSLRTKVAEIVPPNVNLTGAKNVKVENGVVTFGGNMTQTPGAASTNSTANRERIQNQLRNTNNF